MIDSSETGSRNAPISATTMHRLAVRIDPLQPRHMQALGWTITAVVIAIILLPAVFYPFGPDEGLFLVTAQKMLQGAIHYRDIVDIKPPLIYYLYAGIIALLGPSAIAIHLVDVILQGFTCLLIIRLVRRVGGNDLWGALAAICYALLYFILNYSNVAQSESYAGLLGLIMIHLMLFRRRPLGFVLIGVLGGALFLLKFSLVAILGVMTLAEVLVMKASWRVTLRNGSLMAAGFALVFGLFLTYLLAFDAFDDFQLMQQFTRGYVSIQWPSTAAWFKSVSKQMTAYMSDNYSMVMLLATASGISLAIPLRSSATEPLDQHPDAQRLMRICALLFLVLAVTVAVEGKYLPYHFSRFYAFSSILAAFGGLTAVRMFLATARRDRFSWFGAGLVAMLLLLFSPLPRYAWHGSGVVINIVNGARGYDDHYDYLTEGDTILTFRAIEKTGEYLRRHRRPEDQVMLATSAGGLVAYEADYIPDFKVYHFAFVSAPFAPQQWKDETRDYLMTARPRFIVAQNFNHEPTLTGTDRTSEESLRLLPGIDSLLDNDYRLALQTGVFRIYQRR